MSKSDKQIKKLNKQLKEARSFVRAMRNRKPAFSHEDALDEHRLFKKIDAAIEGWEHNT